VLPRGWTGTVSLTANANAVSLGTTVSIQTSTDGSSFTTIATASVDGTLTYTETTPLASASFLRIRLVSGSGVVVAESACRFANLFVSNLFAEINNTFSVGVKYPELNSISLNTSDVERFRIFPDGNTFIGSSPSNSGFKLYVSSPSAAIATFAGATNGYVDINDGTVNSRLQNTAQGFLVGTVNSYNLNLRTNNTIRLTIDGSTGAATFTNTQTTLNFNPQTNLLASYYYLNFGGGSIMYRNLPDIYFGSNAKYGSAGSVVANYTYAIGMGLLTMDGGNLRWQANDTSVTAGNVYSVPVRFAINGDGNIGIGTINANGRLTIKAEVSNTPSLIFRNELGGPSSAISNYVSAGQTFTVIGTNVYVNSTANLERFDTGKESCGILFDEGTMRFVTGPTSTLPFTKMTIAQGGQVSIGITTGNRRLNVIDTSTPLFLHNNNNVSGSFCNISQLGGSNTNDTSSYYLYCDTDSVGVRMVIYGNGNIQNVNNAYGAYSDIKLKENITDATPKLDDLLKVKIRNYNLIGENTKQLGVIAQELEEIFPAMIDESPDKDKDGNDLGTNTKSVKYSVFVPMLIKAIQELKSENDVLKNRLDRNSIN
jgi:hypothetical protein